eukprot:COSAG01_NODE_76361_length_186_cov_52.321839_1_plen_61_part_11
MGDAELEAMEGRWAAAAATEPAAAAAPAPAPTQQPEEETVAVATYVEAAAKRANPLMGDAE